MYVVQGKSNNWLMLAITVTIIATTLTIAPAALNNKVMAQAPTTQAPKSIRGHGQGTITCRIPPPGPPKSQPISFDWTKESNGKWQIGIVPTSNSGSITKENVSAKGFKFSGFQDVSNLCSAPQGASTSIAITGQCGSGTIEFKASNGETGSFTGQATCS
jgi:hypothetical protein